MELDWYNNKLGVKSTLTPQFSFRRMLSFSGEPDRQGSPTWLSLALHLVQDTRLMRSYSNNSSVDEFSPPGSNISSPGKPRSGDRCRRSLSGAPDGCTGNGTLSNSPLSSPTLSPSTKPHICFGCVLHSHDE